MPRLRTPRFPLLLLALLASVLVVLAGLQWRWIGQWSTVEATRQQRALAAAADALDAAFSAPLRAAADAFGEIEASDDAAPAALAARLRAWQSDAALPALLDGVYWVEPGPAPRLLKLDTAAAALRPIAWPEAWAPWRAFFADQPSRLTVPPGTAATVRFSDADVPAAPPGLALPALPTPGPSPLPVRFVFLPLDADALRAALLAPTLDRLLDTDAYDVRVTGPDGSVLYASDPALDALATPDLDRPFGPGSLTNLGVTVEGTRDGLAELVELSAFQTRGASGPWRLRVQHRAGSISAAVARLRWRQLSLAFGVLGVLAAAMALLVRSAGAQRRLAQQQMEFVAGVTHELRTPLAVIRSAGENLADGVVASPEQTRQYGALVRDEGQRLSEMVESVLTLAGADARLPTRQRLALSDLVREAVRQTEPVLASADVQIDLAEPLPLLNGDPTTLTLALRNLLANAARHGKPPIRIEARPSHQADQPIVTLTVSDNGPGLDPADLPHLFDPFYRGRGGSKHTGSGLGLALVRRVAELHGGTVTARNRPAGGCAFVLTLPSAEAP
ncbi:MAG: HAMP domain-containing histidine kinase [Rhodothermaceae bacterium]|nr:HAMP domain-containing histidine kinase [Rhodothermaceae bacterium]